MNHYIFWILVALGLFYTLAPHSLHVSSGLGFGLSHTVHVTIGLVLLVIAAKIHFKQNDAPFDDLSLLATV